jgi:hypothetical protein
MGEICAYFDRVMQQDLLPSGQVSYFPMAEYLGDDRFRTLAGSDYIVDVRKRVVDATYLQTTVASMRPPPYEVGDGVDCVPPNDLPAFAADRERFVVIGAGKTGIDACLWLLRNNIAPERLTWIMPRDAWLMDRANIQPRPAVPAAVPDRLHRPADCDRGRHIRGGLVRTLGSLRQPSQAGSGDEADDLPLRERVADRTATVAAHPRHRADGSRRSHRTRQGDIGRRRDTGRRFGALRRLQRRRTRKEVGRTGFRRRPDHAAKCARVPAGVQRRADRPRRSRLPLCARRSLRSSKRGWNRPIRNWTLY